MTGVSEIHGLFQPYRFSNGAAIDLWGDVEILIQIEPPSDVPT